MYVSPRVSSTALLSLLALSACGGTFERHLTYANVESPSMRGREMSYAVYTPPGFGPDERLPLVVFLHGGGDDAQVFDRFALAARLDEAMRDGRVARAVIVVPQGDLGFWANWYDGSARYEDWVVDEVVPRVAYDYHTLPAPEGHHVMGVSMGGSGAIRFALHRPDRFATATFISAPILDTDAMINLAQNPLLVPIVPMDRIFGPTSGEARDRVAEDDPFARWRSDADRGDMRLMVAWGDEDREPIVATGRRFADHLSAHHVRHEELEFEGNHSWVSWTPVILEALARMVPPSPWAHAPAERGRATAGAVTAQSPSLTGGG
ncbi:MAG: alpha/beta hydrolase [Sandaracinaceae bacterium]